MISLFFLPFLFPDPHNHRHLSFYSPDPHNHRHVRSVLTYQELQEHVTYKSVRLLSMGNARHDSSLPYLRSYLNDTDAHVLLKCAATEALGNFQHAEVSLLLLSSILDLKNLLNHQFDHSDYIKFSLAYRVYTCFSAFSQPSFFASPPHPPTTPFPSLALASSVYIPPFFS